MYNISLNSRKSSDGLEHPIVFLSSLPYSQEQYEYDPESESIDLLLVMAVNT